MAQCHRHIVAVIAASAIVAACSGSMGGGSLPALPRSAPGSNASGGGWTASMRMPPQRLQRPSNLLAPPRPATRDVPPLRRFAAMPRHRPHAPHVRQNERACLGLGIVRPTRFIRPSPSVGAGQCRVSRPFQVSAAASGQIALQPPATLRCQMVPSVEAWVRTVLRPAARRYLGSDIVHVQVAASYSCRPRNSRSGAKLSEHGTANAIDISKFSLADGRIVTVKQGWHGTQGERRFLRYIHRGACEHFSTVLGPNADRYHHDHFHFDLAHHGRRGTYRVCK